MAAAPAGPKTLARNAIFAAVAVFVVAQGAEGAGPDFFDWADDLSALELAGLSVAALALAALVMSWVTVTHLVRQNGRLLLRIKEIEQTLINAELMAPRAEELNGLPVGTDAPAFALRSLDGESWTLDSLCDLERPIVLIFTAPDCASCAALLPMVGRWQRERADELTVALISQGSEDESRDKASEQGVGRVLVENGDEVLRVYGVVGTPSAVLIGPEGVIQSPVAEGPDAIDALITQVLTTRWRQLAVPVSLAVGDPAPEIELPDLEGRTTRLSDQPGETVVVFWDPGCPFCEQILERLRERQAEPPPGAPNLLIVAGGTAAQNQEQGLDSLTLLDDKFETGWRFGASGTPSAVLVDAEGKIASSLAGGGPEVLALAGARPLWHEVSVSA